MSLRVPNLTIFVYGLGLALAGNVLAQPIPIWAGAPITHMNRDDIELFSDALGKTLADSEDGKVSEWENPATRANGSVKAVRTFKDGDAHCRDVFLENFAKGRRERGTYPFCQGGDGEWRFSPGAGVKK